MLPGPGTPIPAGSAPPGTLRNCRRTDKLNAIFEENRSYAPIGFATIALKMFADLLGRVDIADEIATLPGVTEPVFVNWKVLAPTVNVSPSAILTPPPLGACRRVPGGT